MAKILVMDDEEGFRTVIQSVLRPYKHEVFTAEDGRQAVEIAGRERPDIAFLDIRVPGSDGVEVLAEIKKLNPGTKCIMLSGFADPETASDAQKAGAFDFLKKPFKIDDVLKAVDRALQHQGGVPAAIAGPAPVQAKAASAKSINPFFWPVVVGVIVLVAAAVYFLYFG